MLSVKTPERFVIPCYLMRKDFYDSLLTAIMFRSWPDQKFTSRILAWFLFADKIS